MNRQRQVPDEIGIFHLKSITLKQSELGMFPKEVLMKFWPNMLSAPSQGSDGISNSGGHRTSLVVQCLRLHTTKAGGSQVQSLVGELDPTCHNYGVHILQLRGHTPQLSTHMLQLKSCMLQLKDSACRKDDQRSHVPQLRPNAAKWTNTQ